MRSKAKRELTERQRRFVEEYMVDGNATQAAVRAGFAAKTANQQGPRLLVNVGVQRELDRRRAALTKRHEITADRVLQSMAGMAFDERPVVLKSSDRLEALKWLGKHLGLFIDRHELDISARLEDALSTIKAQLSPAAQEELLRAIGSVVDETVVRAGDEAAGEPGGEAGAS